MKLIRVFFLLCALAILLLLTPTSSLQLIPPYSSPSQGLNIRTVTKMATRKLMVISSEHVMKSTVHESTSKQFRFTTGKSKDEEKKLSKEEEEKKLSKEEEEKNALSQYLSTDYRMFRRRRPVHNKSLPLRP